MSARIYVGTYAKYNGGSIKGAWLDLENYSDREAFYAAATALHSDEADPELMFQDFEGFPRSLYSESHVSEELFDWLALDEDERELLAAYQEGIDETATIEQARDAYAGKFDTKEDWAEQFLEETGTLESIPENLRNYFDYAAYARDAEHSGSMSFVRYEGDLWAFHNH